MEEAQDLNPLKDIEDHLDNNFLDIDELQVHHQVGQNDQTAKRKPFLKVEDDEALEANKLFSPVGLPWTKVFGIGKMHGINTLVNVQDDVEKMLIIQ